jgi:tRNA pseudouridine13 synthase
MKIKVKPEDFIVEELVDVPFTKSGPYTILKLKKWSWNTLDVIDFVARNLHVSPRRFSRAGLKDRYALATQYLSFKGDIHRTIKEKNFTLTPVAKSSQPIGSRSMKGNRFSVTLRHLSKDDTTKIPNNIQEVLTYGIANYFDEQRFGSAKHGKGFFAKRLMLGHLKGALQLILTIPFQEDTQHEKRFKTVCREHWGQWSRCREHAPASHKHMMNALVQSPRDYKSAIKTINREMLNLYLLAYQSYLFNESLKKFIAEREVDVTTLSYAVGSFLFYRRLADANAVRQCSISMINEKTDLNDTVGTILKSVIDTEGITLRDFSLRAMRFRGVRFKPFKRNAVVYPERLTHSIPENDELYRGKQKMKIAFTLPPGAYATLLIKRLTI